MQRITNDAARHRARAEAKAAARSESLEPRRRVMVRAQWHVSRLVIRRGLGRRE